MEQHDIDRFWSKVDKSNDCWLWRSSKFSNGYGAFEGYGRSRYSLAHRVAYELVVGPIPDGLTLDHLCRNRACVNPEHLEPVTKRENTLRGIGPAAINAKKTHCKHGHPFSIENTYVTSKGARNCITCRRAAMERCMSKYKDEYNRRRREKHVPKSRISTKGIPHGPMSEETKHKLSEARKALFAQRRAESAQKAR